MYKNIDVKLESTVAGPVSVVCLEAIATRTSQFVIYAHHFECWMLNADHRRYTADRLKLKYLHLPLPMNISF